jgi:hypothetical protein
VSDKAKPKEPKPGEFYNEALGCRFTLPEPFRLRHVERYEAGRDKAKATGAQFPPSVNWVGAMEIVEDWDCEALPDPRKLSPADLDDTHGQALQIVIWVGSQVNVYVLAKLYIPKN